VTALVSCHTAIIIETPALAVMMLNSRDFGILTRIGYVVYSRECLQSSIVDDSFNMFSLPGTEEGEGEGGGLVDAGLVVRRHVAT
jgi:hypothetical protein